jgi:hypothetical protein
MEILGALISFALILSLIIGGAYVFFWVVAILWIIISSPMTWFIAFGLAVWYLIDERKRKV